MEQSDADEIEREDEQKAEVERLRLLGLGGVERADLGLEE